MAEMPSVLFVLPASGGSGGANSVVQEAMGLNALGVRASLAVDARNHAGFGDAYPELQRALVPVERYADDRDLARLVGAAGVSVATTNASVYAVAKARALLPEKGRAARIGYYVQDYEPLFYAPTTEAWRVAFESYAHIPDAALFAKTQWICDMVYANHGVRVARVRPSIDHDIFYPDLAGANPRLRVLAMVRVNTPRRAPRRTLRILGMLADELGAEIDITIFGAEPEALHGAGLEVAPRIANAGRLRREQVPELLRAADLFLDLSDYQAFGRTALEGMACGCVPVLPLFGGADEFARHGRNAFVVDTRNDGEVLAAIRSFASMPAAARADMRHAALETAADYTIRKAALSELGVFRALAGAAA